MNYHDTMRWFGVAFFLILILALIVLPVRAEIQRPMQGDMVAVGSMIDITGVMGWAERIAYYGYSGDVESDPLYVLDLPNTKKGYYQFYLDPAIFGTRLGPWYQFYGNESGTEHGNMLMFRVVKELPKTNITNQTTQTPTPSITPEMQIVPSKKFETDFQVAYGDQIVLPLNSKLAPPRVWVYGRLDSIYNKSFQKQTSFLTSMEVQNLEPGTYTVLQQYPGKNTIFEIGYSKIVNDIETKELLTSPWAAIKPVNVFGLQPRMVLIEFRKLLPATDDTITEYRLEVAHPAIDIVSIDETYSGGKDVIDIRGYTNVATGTDLSFVMDEADQTSRTIRDNTYHTLVQETTPGYWRYFQVIIPIDYETIKVGQHQITAISPQGARQSVPFYVYDMPAGQVKPNATLKYIAGDIFVPTQTPLVITVKETVVVTQTIYVPVTPNDEQVYIAEKKVSDTNYRYWISTGMIIAIIAIVVSVGGWYAIRVVKRARLR